MKLSFQKILSILHVRSVVAGLDISDEVLRLAYYDGKLWQMHAIRLAPGVMEAGSIKNKDAFVASLVELKMNSGIAGRNGRKKATVVVALSSANPYSKVFSLPIIEGENLDKAIVLNVEMVSPGEKNNMYAGWETANRDNNAGTVEILSSFIERSIVDGVVEAIFEAGFIPMAIESKALALTRVLREKAGTIDPKKAYVFVAVDSGGIEFLVVKNDIPYFEYGHRWSDIGDNNKGEISIDAFQKDLATSLRQVMNFYAQQWPEPLSAIILSAVAFHEEIEKTIVANAGIPAVRLTLEMGQPISSEWLAALGACLRGSAPRLRGKEEISFLGEELQDRFHQEQALLFFGFWQAVIPFSFGVLLVAVITANVFLGNIRTSIEGTSSFTQIPSASSTISMLEASSTAFNNEVAMIQSIESSPDPTAAIISDIETIAAGNGITISKLSFAGIAAPITLSGIVTTEDQVQAFKSALEKDKHVSDINLPLTSIQPAGTGYSFSVIFTYQ